MFAVIRTGNQQFKVEAGEWIRVRTLDFAPNTQIQLETLLVGDSKGDVFFDNEDKLSVKAKVLRHGRAKKILVLKKKRRKGYRKLQGHRQGFTDLQILEIKSSKGEAKASLQMKSSKGEVKASPQMKSSKGEAKASLQMKSSKGEVKASPQMKSPKSKTERRVKKSLGGK